MNKMRVFGFILLIFTTCFAYADRSLKIGLTQFPMSLHPHLSPMLAKNFILGMTLRPLTSYDANWELTCLACEALPALDSDDIKLIDATQKIYEVTYHLKNDLFWGDGKPLTVDDILFTWEMGKDPKNGFINHILYRDEILDIKRIDAYSFILVRKKSELPLNDLNDFWILPKHMMSETFYQENLEAPGLYFGPYIVSQYEQGKRVILKQNPYWKGDALAFDEIQILNFKNSFTLEAALLTGEIDMSGVPGVSIENIQNLKTQKKFDQTYKILDRSTLTLELLMPNFDNEFLKDRRIRQALFQSIDREEITASILHGYGKVASGYFNRLDPLFVEPDIALIYDPVQSRQLLREAGLVFNEKKQAWFTKDGALFQLNIVTTSGDEFRRKYLEYCKHVWEKLGVKITLQFVPPRSFFGDILKHRKFTGLALVGWPTTPGFIPTNTFGSQMIPTVENSYVGYNYMGYRNAEMDKILAQSSVEILAFQNLVNEDLPVMPLYYKDRFYIVPKKLEGLKPTGTLFPASFWVEEWRYCDP